MIRITVQDTHGLRVFPFDRDEVTIGRVKGNDLVLSRQTVSRKHTRLVADADTRTLKVEDIASASGTWIDERRVQGQEMVGPDSRIRVGDVEIQAVYEDFALRVPPDEQEIAFLEALTKAPRDDATRAVYADWLEERGKAAEAEFLRKQIILRDNAAGSDAFKKASKRLRSLSSHVDIAWRVRVAMNRVSACGAAQGSSESESLAFDLECSRRWDEMEPTGDPGIRSCTACNRQVYYCASIEEARARADRHGCVAIDVQVSREPGDLSGGPRYLARGMVAPNIAYYGTTADT